MSASWTKYGRWRTFCIDRAWSGWRWWSLLPSVQTFAMAFLTQTKLPVEHAFFDGGQFAQIGKGTRRIMTPFLYFAIKSLYWSKGGTLKKDTVV